jgi:hypothetical protein
MPCGVAPEVASETARSRIASCRGILKGGARAHAHPTAPKSSLAQVGFIQRKVTIPMARTFMERRKHSTRHPCWARGYYVSTVGRERARGHPDPRGGPPLVGTYQRRVSLLQSVIALSGHRESVDCQFETYPPTCMTPAVRRRELTLLGKWAIFFSNYLLVSSYGISSGCLSERTAGVVYGFLLLLNL